MIRRLQNSVPAAQQRSRCSDPQVVLTLDEAVLSSHPLHLQEKAIENAGDYSIGWLRKLEALDSTLLPNAIQLHVLNVDGFAFGMALLYGEDFSDSKISAHVSSDAPFQQLNKWDIGRKTPAAMTQLVWSNEGEQNRLILQALQDEPICVVHSQLANTLGRLSIHNGKSSSTSLHAIDLLFHSLCVEARCSNTE